MSTLNERGYAKMVISSEQCRAGRALLAWTQDELATRSAVAKKTIADFEVGKRSPYPRTLADLRRALEAAGVTFLASGEPSPAGGPGVRLDVAGGGDGEA